MCAPTHNQSRYTFTYPHVCTCVRSSLPRYYIQFVECVSLRVRACVPIPARYRQPNPHQTDPCERIRNESPNPLILSSPIKFFSNVFNHLQLSLRHLHFSYCVIRNRVVNSIHRNAERIKQHDQAIQSAPWVLRHRG